MARPAILDAPGGLADPRHRVHRVLTSRRWTAREHPRADHRARAARRQDGARPDGAAARTAGALLPGHQLASSVILAPPIIVLIVGGVYLFVFRFFYAGNVTFAQSLGHRHVGRSASRAGGHPLILVVMAMKGDWNINPQEALQANLRMLLHQADRVEAAVQRWPRA